MVSAKYSLFKYFGPCGTDLLVSLMPQERAQGRMNETELGLFVEKRPGEEL